MSSGMDLDVRRKAYHWCLLNVGEIPESLGRCKYPRAVRQQIEQEIGRHACLEVWNELKFYKGKEHRKPFVA